MSAIKDEGDDLLLGDPEFLERIATGFSNVKIRPHGPSRSQQADARASTAQFRDRAVRLRAIARRIRALTKGEGAAVVPLVPLMLGLEQLIQDSHTEEPRAGETGFRTREALRAAIDLAKMLKEDR